MYTAPAIGPFKEASVACSTQLHCGGTKACTGRGECNRAAPDAQTSANAKKDSLTILCGLEWLIASGFVA